MYLEAIEMKNEQEIKDRDKQIQEVMKQNTISDLGTRPAAKD